MSQHRILKMLRIWDFFDWINIDSMAKKKEKLTQFPTDKFAYIWLNVNYLYKKVTTQIAKLKQQLNT